MMMTVSRFSASRNPTKTYCIFSQKKKKKVKKIGVFAIVLPILLFPTYDVSI
ncbi:hypothetical protein OAV88_03095 [bacterium]|nr:hypothetical protein [bacterium]